MVTPFDRVNLTGPLVLVVGSEGEGLSRLVRETCDWLISLPMYGHVESLTSRLARLCLCCGQSVWADEHKEVKNGVHAANNRFWR